MKLALATTFNSRDISAWSGVPYYMGNAFEQDGARVERIGELKRKLPTYFKLKQAWKKMTCGQRESPRFNVVAAKHYSEQVANQLKHLDVQAIIAPQINPIAYLESKQPIILWTDALYAHLLGFYPVFNNHSASSVTQGNIITQECLARSTLAIFPSEWAARGAMELYGTSKEKVKVVPYGANIQCKHTLDDIKTMLKSRPRDKIKLLFLGKHWYRKGGDIVFDVTKALHAAGHVVELNFVGCQPPDNVAIPAYIKCHRFISKSTPEGIAKYTQLIRESHFLFVPSRAEAYGLVFCEANAYGLPSLTSHVGGITTIVKNHINGMTFGIDSPVEKYCDYIVNLMQNYSRYEELALSSFQEYEQRLNWNVAMQSVKKLIHDIL